MSDKDNIIILPGDVFATTNRMVLARGINAFQRFWAHDNISEYSHAGIIIDSMGNTLESNWTVERKNIFTDYKDKKVIIARPLGLTAEKFVEAFTEIKKHEGRWYPAYRLFFHMFPPTAKYLSFGKWLVCSELTAKWEYLIGYRHKFYAGTNVDMIVDEWRHWKNFKIIFEGV
jgi:hypothetical protein